MKAHYFTFSLFMACCLTTFSQDKTFYERMHGTNINGTLLLKYDEDTSLFYRCDKKGWYKADSKLFNAANYNHDHTVNVYLQFFNPLQIDVSIKFVETADLSLKVVDDFFASLVKVTPIETGISKSGLDIFEFDVSDSNEKFKKGTIPIELASTELNQWLMEFIPLVKAEFDADKLKSLIATLKLIESVEEFHFSKFKIVEITARSTESLDIAEWLQSTTKNISNATSYMDFKSACVEGQAIHKSLEARKETEKKNLEAVLNMMTGQQFEDHIEPLLEPTKLPGTEDLFRAYSAGIAKQMIQKFKDRSIEIEKQLATFKETLDKCEKFYSQYKKQNFFGEEEFYKKIKTDSYNYE